MTQTLDLNERSQLGRSHTIEAPASQSVPWRLLLWEAQPGRIKLLEFSARLDNNQ